MPIDYSEYHPKAKNMNYAIQVLENEARILSAAIKAFPTGRYQDAINDRKRKLKQLEEAVELIKEKIEIKNEKRTCHQKVDPNILLRCPGVINVPFFSTYKSGNRSMTLPRTE